MAVHLQHVQVISALSVFEISISPITTEPTIWN